MASVAVGLAIAAAAVLMPAWRDLRRVTVANARIEVRRTRAPGWTRFGVDIGCSPLRLLFWPVARGTRSSRPRGRASISVSYWAFVAPALLWIGGALLIWRLADLVLVRAVARWPSC
jgi:putative ABC transport system permease protein